jgi:hypothetical protein
MAKNKVVVFNKDTGGAKVFVTDNPDEVGVFSNEIKFINPDLSFVSDISPELWNLEGDKIVPLFDAEAIRKRMANVGVRSFTNMADAEIKKNVHKLVDIPERVDSLESALVCAIERNRKDFNDEFRELNLYIETKMLGQTTILQSMIIRSIDSVSQIMQTSVKYCLWALSVIILLNLIGIALHFVK